MNGTWTTKPPPKTLQTVLGALVIAVVVVVWLGYGSAQSDNTSLASNRATTPAPSLSPSSSPSPRR